MSKNKRIALIVVSVILLTATAIMLICCLEGTAKESMNHEMPYTHGNLSFEPGEESPEVAITYTRGATATSTGSITKQIKAIVEPADAPDKSVTWEIKWAENASRSDQNIDNYIRIIPNSNDEKKDSPDYEDFTTIVFDALEVIGEPPVMISEQDGFCLSYHNFPSLITVDGNKINQ